MLIQQPQVRIVTKQVTLGNGDVVLAYFAVISTNGAPEVRFLGHKPFSASQGASAGVVAPLMLAAGHSARVFGECVTRWFESLYLQIFKTDLLVQQLARAPSVR